MKTISSDYKNAIKTLGREIDAKITYTLNNSVVELSGDMLNSITPHYEGGILRSVMKQLDIDSNQDIPIGTILECRFGVFTGNQYEYISFGNYVVYSSEKQEDTKSYKLVCYDKMLYSMKDYESFATYPISVRDYLDALCDHIGLDFASISDDFTNYDKEIPSELFLDADGNSLDYTFRDVLDQLAQITASTICINNDDELEIRYISDEEEIPGQYQKVEYIQTTGSQYINTNVLIDNSVKFEIDFSLETTRDWAAIIGVDVLYTNSRLYFGMTDNYNVKKGFFYVGGFSTTFVNSYGALSTRLKATYDGSSLSLIYPNGTTVVQKGSGITISSTNIPMYLFAVNRSGEGAVNQTSMKLYATKIYMNNSIVRDFVPCYRKNDNVIGLYDKVSRTFFTNSGTGTFLKGNDVEEEIVGIDEEFLKDVNVNFGEQYGPVNTITFKRSADSDAISVSRPSNLPDDQKNEIAISDNQFLNDDNRADYIDEILDKLYGLTYHLNDYTSTGITYLDLCDRYNITITDEDTNETTTYSCVMFNDEIEITQGLVENVHTERPEDSETDYNTTTKDDRGSSRTSLIVDKINHEIRSIVANNEQVDIIVNGETNYELTKDETYQENKTYYIQSGNEYIELNQYATYMGIRTGNPHEMGLYEGLYSYSYVETEDTEFDDSDYYEKVGDDYILYTGSRTGNPSELDLYEQVSTLISYQLTDDTSFVENKTYFEKNYEIGDTIPSNTIYEAIRTPSVSEQIEELDSSVDSKLDGFSGRITNVETSVETIQTSTYTKTEVQQIVDGTGVGGVVVSATISETGTFDKDGLLIQKESSGSIISDTTGRFNEKGVQIKKVENGSATDEIFYAGYVDDNRFDVGSRHYQGKTIVYTQNLQAGGETIIGSKCLLKDYESGTGWFVL